MFHLHRILSWEMHSFVLITNFVTDELPYSHEANCRWGIISGRVVLQDKYNKREGS